MDDELTHANILQLAKPYTEKLYTPLHEAPSIDDVFIKAQDDINAARRKNSEQEYPIDLRELTQEEQYSIIEDSLTRAADIESAARNPQRWNNLKQIAGNTALVVDLSAPGTYLRPRKNDRYAQFNWAYNMDRQRADTAAIVGIQIAGTQTDQDFSIFTHEELLGFNPALKTLRAQTKQSITDSGLRFLYLSRAKPPNEVDAIKLDEAGAINKVIHSDDSFIPPEQVDVIAEGDNTVDQVKVLKKYLKENLQSESNPNGFLKPGSAIVFVMGPQAIRTFANTAQFNAIPPELDVYLFPTPTPQSGFSEYVTMETKGRLVYTMRQEAAMQLSTYTLLGAK